MSEIDVLISEEVGTPGNPGGAGAFLAGQITAAGNPDLYQVIVHVGPEALTTSPPPQPEHQPEPEHQPGPEHQAGPRPPHDVPAGTSASDKPAPASRPAGPAERPAAHPAHPLRCHIEDGPALSPATAQRLACQATLTWMLHDHDGTLLDAGRRHRTLPLDEPARPRRDPPRVGLSGPGRSAPPRLPELLDPSPLAASSGGLRARRRITRRFSSRLPPLWYWGCESAARWSLLAWRDRVFMIPDRNPRIWWLWVRDHGIGLPS